MIQQKTAPSIALIGTGLAGMIQAWALAQQDFPVSLIGPVPDESADDRTTAILMPGIDFLKRLDLWADVKHSATPLVTMELIDDSQHNVFDAAEIGQSAFGYNISNQALKKAVLKRLQKNRLVEWHQENADTLKKTATGWEIALNSGAVISTTLLIGADGYHSPTREAANIGTDRKDVDQIALVTVLQAEKPHFNTSVEWYIHGGTITLVPMSDKKLALVWCSFADIQNAKLELPLAKIGAELTDLTAARFGKLKPLQKLQAWKVRPMVAQNLVARDCALVGESAHVLAPIGAQGLNISLYDIMALTDALTKGRSLGLSVNDAAMLKHYERKRLAEIRLRYRSVNALNTLLQSPSRLLRGLRRFSLYGIGHLPAIKKHVMRTGMRQKG